MQPWKISVGLTAAIVGSAAILAAPRLRYLAPYWPIVMADHGVAIALHLALAAATVAAVVYVVARALGLADLGRRVALIERSVRRGDVAPELGRALERDADGEWE